MNTTRRHNQKRRRSAQKRAAEETVMRLRALYGQENPPKVFVRLGLDGGWSFLMGLR